MSLTFEVKESISPNRLFTALSHIKVKKVVLFEGVLAVYTEKGDYYSFTLDKDGSNFTRN